MIIWRNALNQIDGRKDHTISNLVRQLGIWLRRQPHLVALMGEQNLWESSQWSSPTYRITTLFEIERNAILWKDTANRLKAGGMKKANETDLGNNKHAPQARMSNARSEYHVFWVWVSSISRTVDFFFWRLRHTSWLATPLTRSPK